MSLLRTAATVAVASSVHGRIQRRQQNRWARQDQASQPAASVPPPAQPADDQPQPSRTDDRLAQLKQLGDLLSSGVLTQAEFEQQKAAVLNG